MFYKQLVKGMKFHLIQNQNLLERTIESQNENLKQTIDNQQRMVEQIERLSDENIKNNRGIHYTFKKKQITSKRKNWKNSFRNSKA